MAPPNQVTMATALAGLAHYPEARELRGLRDPQFEVLAHPEALRSHGARDRTLLITYKPPTCILKPPTSLHPIASTPA